MHFKKLELIGFKSFLEKTKLHFEPGVTAVVGPNGCGKSNIADAIKWVFGEQAPKSLRASRMEDVIFNGTDQKEPINLAEVSVTLSNESKILPIEYDEVTITRRLFRSGESEYLLNKTMVRLKDIQELLMGTGIGTESYSLIEQGQIDLVLSSKPEERRYIFEEASGITKYKSKKKEALGKLEQTENNLIRVNDIINEVQRQVTSIERQAKKAEKYKNEFERLKELDTKYSLFNYKNLKNEGKITSVEIGDLKRKEIEATAKIAHFSEIAEKIKSDISFISDNFSSLQTTLVEISSSIDKNSHKILVNKERVNELEQMKVVLSEEIKKAEERRVSFEDTLKVLREKVNNFTKDKNAKEDLIKHKEKEYNILSEEMEAHYKDITESKIRTVEKMAEQAKLNNELARFTAEIQSRSSRFRRLEMEEEKTRGELSVSEAKFSQIDGETGGIKKIIDKLNEERLASQKILDQNKEKLNKFVEDLANCEKEASLLKSQLQFLEELVQKYEGFDKGAKYILEAKKKGIFSKADGPICDIVDVEDGLEVAFELALGEDLQSFIVKTRNEAKELLSYLGSSNLGRVSIIILDDLPEMPLNKPIAEFSLRPLADFFRVKNEYAKVLSYLLKDTYLKVDSKEDVFDAIGKLPPNIRVITKEGCFIQRGKVCGGAVRKSSNTSLIGREKKIVQTRAKIKEFDKKIIKLNESIASEKIALQSAEKELEENAAGLREEEIKSANINTVRESVKGQLNRLNDERLVLEAETGELKELLKELSARQEGAKKNLKDIENEHINLENLIVSSQNSIEKKSKEKESLLVSLTQYRTELTSLEREAKGLLDNLTREESAFTEISFSIGSKNKQLVDGAKRKEELEKENELLESENMKNSSKKNRLTEEVEKIRESKAQLMEEVAKEDEKIKSQKVLLDELKNGSHGFEMKKTELSYKQNALRERALQAYKVDLDEVQISIEEGIDWDEIQREIEELKQKLDKMGTVNLVAIEEHQELQERFNFLTHQQQDLLNAKDSLLKAIQKINKTTRSLFFETFTKIQGEFRSFFRLLFGGGQAELVLLDEKDILESGIEIIVRPPGKKLQNISLLSGGEKALTAIALLFAVFKVKPSPFCVLDEIDAALDESNVGRFTNVLKDFVKTSQFIIITHNKKTIQLADVMYGITMEESGISRIVSVKFADTKKEEQKAEILA